MFNLFKKERVNENDDNHLSLISIAALLIHSAKIDENFTDKERTIIKNALIEMGADKSKLDEIIKEAELKEKDSNQILEFTKEVKNKNIDEKKIVIEALWNIIYSDENADIYETNLMRRLSGLLYLDHKIVGEIVNLAEMKKTSLEKLDMKEMKKVCNKISKDVYDILHIENSVNLKSTYGSTSKQSVKKQISLAHKLLKK